MNFPKTAGNNPDPNIVKGVAEDCGVAGSPVNGDNQRNNSAVGLNGSGWKQIKLSGLRRATLVST